MPKKWTEEDCIVFKQMYSNHTRKQMAEYFGVTESSIQNKARRLGITDNVQDRDRGNIKIFETINSEDSAYWLGFIYADGYIIANKNKRNYELGIELSSLDIEHLNKFYIVPGLDIKLARFGAHLFPSSLVSKITYMVQKRKLQ